MEEIEVVATFVAKVLIYSGGFVFLICFLFGAKLLWEMFKLAIYTSRLVNKWNQYKRIPIEGREDALKTKYFEDDTKEIK